MDEVFKQAPDGMNYEDIEIIFNNNDNNCYTFSLSD